MVHWTPAMDAALKAERDKGLSFTQCGEALGLTVGQIAGRLHRLAGAPLRSLKWTPERDAQLLALRAEGKRNAAIASEMNDTESAIRARLHKISSEGARDASGRRSHVTTEDEVLVAALVADGESLAKAAQIAGVTEDAARAAVVRSQARERAELLAAPTKPTHSAWGKQGSARDAL